jgi:5-methylcytosine-specific restriction endonuclease McrA
MRTLVLNAGYEPMQLISWQRALCLVIAAKAEIVAEYDKVVRTISTQFKLPSVVRLKGYVKIARRFGIVRCTRRNVFLRDRYRCQYCGAHCSENHITIDHVVPRAKGGRTTWNNVVAACPVCNRKKGHADLKASGLRLLKAPRRPAWNELMGSEDVEPMAGDWLPYLDFFT